MATSPQPKTKPSVYTGLEDDDQFGRDRVMPISPPERAGSSTAIIVIIALAILAALGYFYFADTTTTVATTPTPPVTTQDITPTQPLPANPPAAPVQNAPVAPAN